MSEYYTHCQHARDRNIYEAYRLLGKHPIASYIAYYCVESFHLSGNYVYYSNEYALCIVLRNTIPMKTCLQIKLVQTHLSGAPEFRILPHQWPQEPSNLGYDYNSRFLMNP